jgi:hypothetical protein
MARRPERVALGLGYPLPENLKEVLSLTISVGEQLDIEQLADEA